MNPAVKRWIICACIGMCLPATLYSVRTYMHRNDRYAAPAHALGVDVDKWADVNRTLTTAGTRHTLSNRELDQVAIWSHDGSVYVRTLAVATLRQCTDPALVPRVFALARPCLHDANPGVRLKAVNLLWKRADPDLRADVAPVITDSDPTVRDTARKAIGSAAAGPGASNGN